MTKFLTSVAMLLAVRGLACADPAPVATTPDVVVPAPSNGAVMITYRFTPGEDLKYGMSSTTSGTMNLAGRSMPMTTTFSADIDQVVQSVDASGNATLRIGMSNPQMAMNMSGKEIPIPADKIAASMKGFTIVMSPEGKMISAQPAGAVGGPGDISKLLQPGALGNMALLPDHPVNIGDDWRGSMAMAALGMQVYMKMTLNGISTTTGSHVANIGVKSFATFSPHSMASGAPAMTGQMNGQGTMGFDIDNGYQKSFDQNSTLTMNIGGGSNPATGAATPGGLIPMTIDSSMNLISVTTVPIGSAPTTGTVPDQSAPTTVPAPKAPVQ